MLPPSRRLLNWDTVNSVLASRLVVLPSKKDSMTAEDPPVRMRSPATMTLPAAASCQASLPEGRTSTTPLTSVRVAVWTTMPPSQDWSSRPPAMSRTSTIAAARASWKAGMRFRTAGLPSPLNRVAIHLAMRGGRLGDTARRRFFSASACSIRLFPASQAPGLERGRGTRRTSIAISSSGRRSAAWSG